MRFAGWITFDLGHFIFLGRGGLGFLALILAGRMIQTTEGLLIPLGRVRLTGAERPPYQSWWKGVYGMIALVDLAQIDFAWLAISVVALLFSLSLHESAHAWAADSLGDPTGRLLGRVSLNPLVHLDLIGSVVFPLIGLVLGGVVFGWAKPVPVNPMNLKNPKLAHLYIAAAGPLSNLIAAVGFLIFSKLIVGIDAASPGAMTVVLQPLLLLCQVALVLNVILAVFNLIPIPPLDGSWILRGLLPENIARFYDQLRPYGFLLLLLMLYTGVIGRILRPLLGFVYEVAF